MKIKILHLYHDIMNLYGEYANVSVLCRHLEDMDIEAELTKASINNDSFNISDYDFVYCGAGTERNRAVVLSDFLNHKDELSDYCKNGGIALFTGNSFEMLGKRIFTRTGDELECMALADFEVFEGGESYKKFIEENPEEKALAKGDSRLTGDAVFTADFTEKPVIGFVNKCGFVKGKFTPMFGVKYGMGNNNSEKSDGVRINNILGTHLTGPLLVKNPPVLSYVISLLTNGNAEEKKEYKSEVLGYEVTVNELLKRFEEK